MKILFIGDPHIKNENHEEVDILISQLKMVCEREKFDRIVIAGDLMHYHERLFTQSLNKSLDFVKILATYAPTDILVGNHDMINNQQFLTSNHWLNVFNHQNVFVIDTPTLRKKDDFTFLLCPYVYPGRFLEAIERVDWKSANVIFAHQEFKGCKMGAIVSKEGDTWDEKSPQVVSGHIHDNQRPQSNIYYPGSPLQHAFGDKETRVVCCIENGVITDIPLDVPKKQIISTTLSNLSVSSLPTSSTLKLKIKATPEEFKLFKQTKDYKTCIEKGIKIQLNVISAPVTKNVSIRPFKVLLNELIDTDGNPLLKKLFTEIVKI